ncbi:MAG: preprotein translocase subunit SecY [Rhodospirillaceae bacterium]|nr:MAG: preprotein translocase subunit SecY [Rhodospirillaceae bacterium]
MASTGEKMGQNAGRFGAFSKATDLQKRIWFALGALIVYRLGTYIPLPGINAAALKDLFSQNSGGLLGMFDMFTGGALSRMTIFALNIMPYISASIIMQLMTTISPSLEAMKKEGANGSKRINQYTRYLTVLITVMQAYGIAVGLESMNGIVQDGGWFFRFTTVVTLTGGTIFLMWLGEQITQRGIGNGISLIIFAGIVANLPTAVASTLELGRTGALSAIFIIGLIIMVVGVIFLIVFVERAQRRIIVQYPKRQQGNRMSGGESTHLPLKINTAGVIPPIFAGSVLGLPVTIMGLSAAGQGPEWVTTMMSVMGRGQPGYLITFVFMIVFFSFFYTAVVFNPSDTADNLKKYGGFIPGIRPGKNTSDYLDKVLTRLTVIGAAYLSAICLLPEILMSKYSVPFYFGGTSLLIVVTVTMDTVTQVQSHLMAHQYEGLIKKSKLRGKRKK